MVGYAGNAKAMRESVLEKANARKAGLEGAGKLNNINVDLCIIEDLLKGAR